MPSIYTPLPLLFLAAGALAYSPGSYESCRATLGPIGPFSFSPDGSAVDVQGKLDPTAENIEWNKRDRLTFQKLDQEAGVTRLYEFDFFYNHAQPKPKLVTVQWITTSHAKSTANGRMTDTVHRTRTYTLLNPDHTSECVLQEIISVKNGMEKLPDDEDGMFDLEACKKFLDLTAAHPEAARGGKLHAEYQLLDQQAGNCEARREYVLQYFAAHQKLQPSDVKFYPGSADPAR